MAELFLVDGVPYNVRVPVGGLRRSFDILDGQNSGRMEDLSMTRDVKGTFYNYQMNISELGSDPKDYDDLYEILSAPQDSHIVTLPYGQSVLTFDAYITKGEDALIRKQRSRNYWGGLNFRFVAMRPQRRR